MITATDLDNTGSTQLSTHEKALKINLTDGFYGTFAEIGAGQEVARWFFRVGGAAGTVAKSMSAYDMTFSDAIYGPAERYVSQERLNEMMDHEYYLLQERLQMKQGDNTRFFVFANTVSAQGFNTKRECHAWMGIRLQMTPGGEPNDIIFHVRLLDSENLQQQEAIGIMGTNLIFAAFEYWEDLDQMLDSLYDGLTTDRIEIDMFKMNGPDLAKHDNRIANLKMVQKGMTKAALFAPNGEVLQPSDEFYKKSILLERGYFRPVTKVNIDMMEKARARFLQEPEIEGSRPIEVMEITMRNLLNEGEIDAEDFLARVDSIGAMNKLVLISRFGEFYKLQSYLETYTRHLVGIVVGLPLLAEIFNEKYYEELHGGILESFGRLFRNKLKFYIYPSLDDETGAFQTARGLELPEHLAGLHRYLMDNDLIVDLPAPTKGMKYVPSEVISEKIASGDETWMTEVPPKVVSIIKEHGFFGFNK